jgi:hypothetical protein
MDNFEISSNKEDTYFMQDLRLSLLLLKIQAFLDMMLCCLVIVSQHFKGS